MAKKNGSLTPFPWALFVALACWAGSLVAAQPTVLLHSDPAWIGKNVWVGGPVLFALVVFMVSIMRRWRAREERRLQRTLDQVNDELLLAKEKHPRQLREKQDLEQKRKVAELEKEAADLKKEAAEREKKAAALRNIAKRQAAELRKQQLREDIKRAEEGLQEERLRRGQESVA
jgi:hypothetical protein